MDHKNFEVNSSLEYLHFCRGPCCSVGQTCECNCINDLFISLYSTESMCEGLFVIILQYTKPDQHGMLPANGKM